MELVTNTLLVTRREFLQVAGALPLQAAIDAQTNLNKMAFVTTRSFGEFIHAFEIQQEANEHKKFLRDRYGVTVETGPLTPQERKGIDGKPVPIEGTALSPSEELEVLRTLRQEIIKYPPSFIKKIELWTFRYLKDLRWEGKKQYGGLSDYNYRRVYLSYREAGWWNLFGLIFQDRYSKLIHHEINHFVVTYFGKTSSLTQWRDYYPIGSDPYIHTWDYTQDPFTREFWMSAKERLDLGGFAYDYGKINEEEDITTVAMALFSNDTDVPGRARTDEILKWKIDLFKAYLSEVSRGAFNAAFWQDLEANRVGEDYWPKKKQLP